jgi:hypothetical protein
VGGVCGPREAIRRGCRGAYLDTFSYQARPFYEKLGYAVFGTLDDYPPGHQRFFMRKRLGEHTASNLLLPLPPGEGWGEGDL